NDGHPPRIRMSLDCPVEDRRRRTDAGAELRKAQNLPEYFHFKRRTHVGAAGNGLTDDAAHVQEVENVTDFYLTWHDALVSLQRVAVTERSGDHIACMQNAQTAVNVFQLIVNAFLAADPADPDRPWPRFDFRRERNLTSQLQIASNRADFIEMN